MRPDASTICSTTTFHEKVDVPFAAEDVREVLETLHIGALKLFHASVSPELLGILREPVTA